MSKCEAGACIDVYQCGTNVRIRSTISGTVCQATLAEWQAFLNDLADGKWAHIGEPPEDAGEPVIHSRLLELGAELGQHAIPEEVTA